LERYVTSLFDSALPFDPWVAVLVWAVLFLANYRIAKSTRVANDAQHFIAVEDWSRLRRGFEPKNIVARVLVTGVVFVFSWLIGESAFVFFAGGLIVATAYGLGLNTQGLLSARAMADSDTATGTLTFSTAAAFRHMGHRAAGGALACGVTGVALAHLALLGGALFLASTAASYSRRARNARGKS
jgi:hypothetical protein